MAALNFDTVANAEDRATVHCRHGPQEWYENLGKDGGAFKLFAPCFIALPRRFAAGYLNVRSPSPWPRGIWLSFCT